MKITSFHNKYYNKECLILGCGPSLEEYDSETIREFAKGKIVICIKEAVLRFEDICDIFTFNRFRVRDYNITSKKIKVIFQGNLNDPMGNNKIDFLIPYDRDFKQKCLLKNHEFELNNFDYKLSRTWGPGIVLETVFYLCLYSGIKICYTIGWDGSNPHKIGMIEHFFDNSQCDRYSASLSLLDKDYKNEIIIHAYNYFKNKGMNIIICGEESFLDKNIPRKKL
jgi:hypothetical protein